MEHILFCANGDCDNLLTDYELSRLGVNSAFQHSKLSFCAYCRKYQLKKIAHLRCFKCRCVFSANRTIFQRVCDSCNAHLIIERKRTSTKREIPQIA